MGFFKIKKVDKREQASKLCSLFGCKVCPAYRGESFQSDPEGAKVPDIYILSKHVSAYADCSYTGEGAFKKILKDHSLRFGVCVRCGSETSLDIIDSCSSFLKEDIQEAKPKVIIGLGEKPLNWALDLSNVTVWRGRHFPIQVGNHVCWFIPLASPGFLSSTLRKRQKQNEHTDVFEKDLKFVSSLLDKKILPKIESPDNYYSGIDLNYGKTQKDINEIEEQLDIYAKQPEKLGLDIETHKLKPYMTDARMLSAAISTGLKTFSFLIDHPTQSVSASNEIKRLFASFLKNSPPKICHNLNFEAQWFDYVLGRSCLYDTLWEDTMAQGYIIDERQGSRKGQHPTSLDMSILRYYGFRLKPLSDIAIEDLITVPPPKLLTYNSLDAKYTNPLFYTQEVLLQDPGLHQSYRQQVDSALTLSITQNLGVNIDWERWEELQLEYKGRLDIVLKRIKNQECVKTYVDYRGASLNLNADAQLAHIFKHILKIPAIKYTAKSKKYAVDDEVLKKLKEDGVEFAELIIEYRFLSNMITKYIDSIPKYTEHDGILHTNYNSLLTRTQRLSSNGPNMQNFPKSKDKQIRSFIYLKKSLVIYDKFA